MRAAVFAALLCCSAVGSAYAQDEEPIDPLAPGTRPGEAPAPPAPRGDGAPPPPPRTDLEELRREMEAMRARLEALEREAGAEGTAPGEPVPGQLWAYARENLRFSIILNNFFVYRDHSPLSTSGPTGKASAFTVGQLELDLWSEHRFGVDFRVDVDLLEDDGQRLGGTGTFNHPEEVQLEQGYLQVDFARLLGPGAPPIRLVFGKFNAPNGFEPIDAPGLWQFSRSNLATYLTCSNLVGAKVGYFSDLVDAEAWIANGWDLNDDTDKEKSGGARITLRLLGSADAPMITIAPAILYGHERTTSVDAGSKRLVADLVVVVRPIERVQLALETNFGHENDPIERDPLVGGVPIAGGDRATWDAYLGAVNVRLTEWLAVTLRGEYIRDRHGFHTRAVRQTGELGRNYLKSGTVALCFKVPTGAGQVFEPLFINLEYRYDRSNRRLFTSRSPSAVGDETHASQLALQVFFHF